MKRLIIIIALLTHLCANAQVTDSLSIYKPHKSLFDTKAYQMTYVAVPLIAAGLIVKGEDDHFQSLRNDYMPEFHTNVDDYLQLSPAVIMYALKACGVESRSSWGRMMTSDAFAGALTLSSVMLIKNTTNVMRPDGSTANSFPSGHTATAFMAATMLHKEYGNVSPWISIGGYSLATATGMMRVVNNRHWMSDVLVGAGIGILSTELGYFLADLIFKDKGINYDLAHPERPSWFENEHPSTFGLSLGLSMTLGQFYLDDNTPLSIETGSRVGFEGAYFFNKYVGIGGRLSIANSPLIIDNEAQDEALDVFGGAVGGYFALPLSDRIRLSSKIVGSYNYYQDCKLEGYNLDILKGGRFGVGTGGAIEYLSSDRWSMKIFVDYDLTYLKGMPQTNFHQMMVVGATANIVF